MRMPSQDEVIELAACHAQRPGFAPAAIDSLVEHARLEPGARVVDLGARTGHLTVELAARGLDVIALEPDEAMRDHGINRTRTFGNVTWAGSPTAPALATGSASIVACGGSFRAEAASGTLREAARLLSPGGWFACLWNHRDLNDPLQARIEAFIRRELPRFTYGIRRDDPSRLIAGSNLFDEVTSLESAVLHHVSRDAWLDAWRSHQTLRRQAGDRFEEIVDGIGEVVRRATAGHSFTVPYVTRVWIARCRASVQATA